MTTYTISRLSDCQAQKELATQRRYMQRHRAELCRLAGFELHLEPAQAQRLPAQQFLAQAAARHSAEHAHDYGEKR